MRGSDDIDSEGLREGVSLETASLAGREFGKCLPEWGTDRGWVWKIVEVVRLRLC